jgi:hypothetical protein
LRWRLPVESVWPATSFAAAARAVVIEEHRLEKRKVVWREYHRVGLVERLEFDGRCDRRRHLDSRALEQLSPLRAHDAALVVNAPLVFVGAPSVELAKAMEPAALLGRAHVGAFLAGVGAEQLHVGQHGHGLVEFVGRRGGGGAVDMGCAAVRREGVIVHHNGQGSASDREDRMRKRVASGKRIAE